MLFKKAILFTDLHLGLKGNISEHNDICIEYINWLIKLAKENDVDTAIFMGDYFHNRSMLNIKTMNYGIRVLKMLDQSFSKIYFIVGNHDMYYRTQRDITSVKFAESFQNVEFIDTIKSFDNCLFVPFLVNDEWKDLTRYNSQYVFGHFELPGYKLNSLITMPDHGKETENTFNKCEYVFSGHFHKRQRKTLSSGTEIHYIGNCFPHNFNDAWDDARGCVILEHNNQPMYYNWENAPKYRTANLSSILENPESFLSFRTTIKVNIDINCSLEEISFIRETYKEYFKLTDFKTIGAGIASKSEIYNENDIKVENVDQVVVDQITAIDTNTLDKMFLIDLYNNL